MDAFEFAVADNFGFGIIMFQCAEQCEESLFLGRGTGVSGAASLVETALVADADGMGVVVAGVGSDHRLGATEVELTVAGDVVVVAAAFPAASLMHLVEQP